MNPTIQNVFISTAAGSDAEVNRLPVYHGSADIISCSFGLSNSCSHFENRLVGWLFWV